MTDCNYFPIDYNSGTEDRREFERKHNANPPSGREDAYSTLADWEHNSIPMHEFCRDNVYDNDTDMYNLIIEALKPEFSNYGIDDPELGKRFRKLIKDGFNDHTAGEGK